MTPPTLRLRIAGHGETREIVVDVGGMLATFATLTETERLDQIARCRAIEYAIVMDEAGPVDWRLLMEARRAGQLIAAHCAILGDFRYLHVRAERDTDGFVAMCLAEYARISRALAGETVEPTAAEAEWCGLPVEAPCMCGEGA